MSDFDLWILVVALLLIFALIYDNRNHPEAWHDGDDDE